VDPEALEAYGGTYFRFNLQKISIVDLCFYTLFQSIEWNSWRILEDSGSDHAVIAFTAYIANTSHESPILRQLFNYKKADWEAFEAKFQTLSANFSISDTATISELDSAAKKLTNLVALAAKKAIPILKITERSKPW
jgi:hypothetical protein